MARLRSEVLAAVQHGNFEITVEGAKGDGGERTVRIKAGKIHEFVFDYKL